MHSHCSIGSSLWKCSLWSDLVAELWVQCLFPQKPRAYVILRRGEQGSLHLWLRSKRKHGEVLHVKNEGGSETLSSKRKSKEERRHKEKHWVAEAEAKWPNLKGCLKKKMRFLFMGGWVRDQKPPFGKLKGNLLKSGVPLIPSVK